MPLFRELEPESLKVSVMGLQLCGLPVWYWLVSTVPWLVAVERQLDLSSVIVVGFFIYHTEKLFLCCIVLVGYWHHELVVRSGVVASFLSDSCFATGCGLCVVTPWLRFYTLRCAMVMAQLWLWLWFHGVEMDLCFMEVVRCDLPPVVFYAFSVSPFGVEVSSVFGRCGRLVPPAVELVVLCELVLPGEQRSSVQAKPRLPQRLLWCFPVIQLPGGSCDMGFTRGWHSERGRTSDVEFLAFFGLFGFCIGYEWVFPVVKVGSASGYPKFLSRGKMTEGSDLCLWVCSRLELGPESLKVSGMGLQLCGLQVWCWLVSTVLWLVAVKRQLDLSSVTAKLRGCSCVVLSGLDTGVMN
ncbi:hypothetical protein Taro_014706 [Colocasia esculenta]|uniref:Uncharacterized protein n=1 Tax=Colocasia esculenta TaxID=4460 RepID=A0A843UML4_COLES|nr:hypothetical protein [Colocasia esculenta]